MKRSEMISKLVEEFHKYESPENIAERALSLIEKEGMKPPNRHFCLSHDCEHEQNFSWEFEK